MQFGLSEEQKILVESVSRHLADNVPLERTREFAEKEQPRADDVSKGLCDLGVPGLMIAEEHGGTGLGLLDAALLAEAFGYHVTPAPYVASAVMAPVAIAAAGSEAQRAKWLPGLADGSVTAGAALGDVVDSAGDEKIMANGAKLTGKARFVLDFEADVYLIAEESGALYLVDANASGLSREGLHTIDKTRRYGNLALENVEAERLEGGPEPDACARVLDAGRVILAADTLGAAQCMLDQAVSYAKERVQFGRVIGSFQAVKHMCAEMAAELEPCRSMIWYAAHAFDTIPDETRLTACHAKAHLGEVGKFVARTSTEVHGGIGFTDELGLHYWFKRIGANRQLLGGPELVREEAAKLQQLV